MSQEYRHMNTSVSLINYHFVWCPRRRKPVLKGMVGIRLKELIEISCSEIDVKVIALEVMPDYVHAFLNCSPTIAPFQVMHKVKGHSARFLRREFVELMSLPSLWTRSYFVSTAGNVSSETIKKYIAEQSTRA
jgi:putative transposase